MNLHFPDGQKYDCVQCGRSCSYYGTIPVESRVVESLSPHPLGLRVIDSHGAAFDKREDGSYVMHMRAPQDPTCVFLNEENLCSIHAEIGPQAKPVTCRQYPFQFTKTPEGLFIGASFFCTAIRQNHGRPLIDHAEDLLELLPEAIIAEVPDPIPLDQDRTISWQEYRALERTFLQDMARQGLNAATQALLLEQFQLSPEKLQTVLNVADFSALKLVLNLPPENDQAFAKNQPLNIPQSNFQGSWDQLIPDTTYNGQLEAWARMYIHRKLLILHRPLHHNLWTLALIPRLCRRLSRLWPYDHQFWTSLEQAELLLGPRGRATDALAQQFNWFLNAS